MKRTLIVAALVLALSVTAVVVIPQAKAVQRGGPGNDWYWRYRNVDENLFKAAAYIYYNNQGVLGRVDCMPKDVVIEYKTGNVDPYNNWLAWANLYGAYEGTYPEGSKKYCRVFWNTNYPPETRPNACVTFIHEYGHLLGREHNFDNTKSPMYQGFELYSGNKAVALWRRWHKNLLARTVCNAAEIRGR